MRSQNAIKSLLIIFSATAALISATITWGHEGEEQGKEQLAPLSAAEQEIADFLAAYAKAFASGDLQRIETFFIADERLSYFEGTFVDRGWASYRKHLAEELPVFSDTSYTISDIRPQVDGNMAFATYSWGLDTIVISDQFEGGKHPVNMRGIATAILVRDSDQWRFRHVHTAREAAAAATHGED